MCAERDVFARAAAVRRPVVAAAAPLRPPHIRRRLRSGVCSKQLPPHNETEIYVVQLHLTLFGKNPTQAPARARRLPLICFIIFASFVYIVSL